MAGLKMPAPDHDDDASYVMSDDPDIPSDDLIEEKLFDFLEGQEVEWFILEHNRKAAFRWLVKITALALSATSAPEDEC
jgi:hypothetical protein